MAKRYWVVFQSEPAHPLLIVADNFEHFVRALTDMVYKYGNFLMIYQE